MTPEREVLEALAARVEALTEPSREVDLKIERLTNTSAIHDDHLDRFPDCARRYTASLDAALTLVPEGVSINLHTQGRGGFAPKPCARTFYYSPDDEADGGFAIGSHTPHPVSAATPALALTAALRARAAGEPS